MLFTINSFRAFDKLIFQQPWGMAKSALKGRQIDLEETDAKLLFIVRAAIALFCAGAHYFSHWEIVFLPNRYSLPFSLAIGRIWAHVISRPFRANRFAKVSVAKRPEFSLPNQKFWRS